VHVLENWHNVKGAWLRNLAGDFIEVGSKGTIKNSMLEERS